RKPNFAKGSIKNSSDIVKQRLFQVRKVVLSQSQSPFSCKRMSITFPPTGPFHIFTLRQILSSSASCVKDENMRKSEKNEENINVLRKG
ncbi:hypothetical protein, partial [Brevibacillus agri]|uniref:hypothetical protein n=1 Tax=Brevibacillus agri TaxID=51101 RepID=UPI001C8F0310